MRTPLLSVVILLSACVPGAELDPACGLLLEDTQTWPLHDEHGFTLQLPPAFRRVQVQGIDSQVGQWNAGARSVSYDLGWYSDRLEPASYADRAGLLVCRRRASGTSPRVVVYRSGVGVETLSAHWANVNGDLDLTLTVRGPESTRAEALTIVRSVTFTRR